MGGRASFPVVPLTKDRVIVVTGANTGIGYEIAKQCAIMGATVILACRSEDRARDAARRMQDEYESEVVGADGDGGKLAVEVMQVDLGSFESVMNFCEEFKKTGRQLHVLFCNAGLGLGPYSKTKDGLELTLQVNYLSHFLMIAKLLPIIKRSGPDCRIILTSSAGHEMLTGVNVEEMNFSGDERNYGPFNYYCRSKAYQIMQTYTMAQRLKGSNISINCYHPGMVETEFFRYNVGKCMACFSSCVLCFGCARTPLTGATCGIDLAVNPKHAGVSGHYWVDCRVKTSKAYTRDEPTQEEIWKESFKFLKDYLTEDDIAGMDGK